MGFRTNVTITSNKWLQIKEKSPRQLHRLIDLCIDLLKHNDSLSRKSIYFGRDVSEFVTKIFRIIAEYEGVMYAKLRGGERYKKVEEDIYRTLSQFFDNKGRMSSDFTKMLREENASFELQTLSSTAVAFIESRIYDALSQTLGDIENEVYTKFCDNSLERAGIMPPSESEREQMQQATPNRAYYEQGGGGDY